MDERDQGAASAGSKRTLYALIGALALAAFLLGVVGLMLIDRDPDDGAVSAADQDATQPANGGRSPAEGSTEEPGSNDEETPATSGAAGGQPSPSSSGSSDDDEVDEAPTTVPDPTEAAAEQATPQPAQGASPTNVAPTATTAPTQMGATATPTRTPTKAAPTATKTATKTATPTRTPTPMPTVVPTVIPNSSYFLDIEIDDSESVSGPVARPSGPLGANVTVYIIFEGSATKARVVIQGTCTGTGAQHVRFVPHGDEFELIPCNRTLVDVVVQKSGNAPKAVAFIEVAALEPGPTNVQWTIAATTLAVD